VPNVPEYLNTILGIIKIEASRRELNGTPRTEALQQTVSDTVKSLAAYFNYPVVSKDDLDLLRKVIMEQTSKDYQDAVENIFKMIEEIHDLNSSN
jgi:hypothetical protein